MKKNIIIIASFLFILFSYSFTEEVKWENETNVKKITFQWTVEAKHLRVRLVAPTWGWISVGFKPVKMMKGADFIIGYCKDTNVIIEDHYGTKPIRHKLDTELGGKDDILDKAGFEVGGTSELTFRIPLDSGDQYDKVLKKGELITVLLAYGGRDDTSSMHREKAKLKVKL